MDHLCNADGDNVYLNIIVLEILKTLCVMSSTLTGSAIVIIGSNKRK